MRMALIRLGIYVEGAWHVTQAVSSGHYAREPAPFMKILSSTGNGKTSGHDAGRTIGVPLKSAQTVTLSAITAIGRTIGKPLAAIEVKKA